MGRRRVDAWELRRGDGGGGRGQGEGGRGEERQADGRHVACGASAMPVGQGTRGVMSANVRERNAWRAAHQEEQIVSEYNRPPLACCCWGGAVCVSLVDVGGGSEKGSAQGKGMDVGARAARGGSGERCVQEKEQATGIGIRCAEGGEEGGEENGAAPRNDAEGRFAF